eukprot:Clim_evm26s146 gene=Clim_evmTU26s146
MPAAAAQFPGGAQPSKFERAKLGAMMGFSVGASIGCILGSYQCFRMGLRGRDFVRTVGKVMLQSGGSFGFFMGIGSVIRS